MDQREQDRYRCMAEQMNIQTLQYESAPLRVVMIDGEPHWIAADVCHVLEIGNNREALARLDDDEKGVILTDTPGGPQNMATVAEAGLYSLILGSRKPQAKAFKRWVTHEVLPQIRATGSYRKSPETAIEWAQAFIRAETERIRLEKQVADDAPKVAEWQSLMDSKGAQKIGAIAKCLGYGPNKFFARLRADGVLTQDNLPRSEHQHLFDVVQKILPTGRSQSVTLVKPEGMSYLARRYAQPQPIRKMELVK